MGKAMKRAIAGILCLVLVTPAFAQQQTRDEAIKAFSDDVAELQDMLPKPEQRPGQASDPRFQDFYPAYALMSKEEKSTLLDDVIKKANDIKQAWSDNPYVQVDGFSIGMTWIPSIDVHFSFKDGDKGK